mgnify:CR=1 FL=1|tara:strand:- start:277 stop:2475 length:2199 start_codon:yes stop_codon:yes gene_type:complete
MALVDFKLLPGIDKQQTQVGADRRWVSSDNVRFRYGLPEKVGGWSSLLTDTIVGVARSQHSFVDLDGNRYVAIGTDKFLLIYFEGQLYDITPLGLTISALTFTFNGTTTITMTSSGVHGFLVGDIILFDSVTLPGGTGLTNADFEDKLFQVISVPTSTTFTITFTASGSTAGPGGSVDCKPYIPVGPAAQTYGYGFGVGQFGGTVAGAQATTLNGALNADTAGTGGVGTTIALTSATGFPTGGGTIAVENELITYTSVSTNDLIGCTRGAQGTATTGTSNGQAHSSLTVVTDATLYTGWGSAVAASTTTLEPGLWSLDNFGDVLLANVANGKIYSWDSSIAARFTTRASTTTPDYLTSSAPTANRSMMMSPVTRHLVLLGTETTIGVTTSQDDMFIRFSDQETINTFAPTAINTAGSQRLQDGTKIMGAIKAKDNILVWTDTALYTMKHVGAPFTFGFEQVGTNCGLIGQNAVVEIDGVAYWMSNKGFFLFDGTVKSLTCTIEDYVYDDIDTTKGQQICAAINNLFTEVVWYYPTSGASYNDRYAVYNYGESAGGKIPGGVWYPGTEARTSWMPATIYPNPFATKFDSTATGTFPSVIGETGLGQTTYFEQEVGTNQINPNGSSTAIAGSLESYDFDLDVGGAGQHYLSISRFLPDFKTLTGNATVTLKLKRFPSSTATTSIYSPFTVTSSSTQFNTRARGRFASVEIANAAVDDNWRFGTMRLDVKPDGMR